MGTLSAARSEIEPAVVRHLTGEEIKPLSPAKIDCHISASWEAAKEINGGYEAHGGRPPGLRAWWMLKLGKWLAGPRRRIAHEPFIHGFWRGSGAGESG